MIDKNAESVQREIEQLYLKLAIADELVQLGAPEKIAIRAVDTMPIVYKPLDGFAVNPEWLDDFAHHYAGAITDVLTDLMKDYAEGRRDTFPDEEDLMNELKTFTIHIEQFASEDERDAASAQLDSGAVFLARDFDYDL